MIIFDLDGVLVDACDWHRDALNRALLEVCNYEITIDQHYNIFNGIPTKVKLSKLTDMGIIDPNHHDLVYKLKQKYTIDIIKEKADIRKEKINMIEALKSKEMIVCCYTNSIRTTAELMLKKTGIYGLFDKILTNQDVYKPKPDPGGYNFLMSYYNINPNQCIIVEDSPKGIQAAKGSGANLIIVKNPDDVNIELFKEII